MLEYIIALTIFLLISIGFICCAFGWLKEEAISKQLEAECKKLFIEYQKQKALASFYENELKALKNKKEK